MEKISVGKIALAIGGRLIGDNTNIDFATTDSREVKDGAMFIGIKGDRVDGNDYAVDFLKNGGSCAVVEKNIEVPEGKCAIVVEDTKKAIRDIAEFYRTTLDIDVVAVTGSVGKTSTKEMLYSVISRGFSAFATKGNFNNEIGVPLTDGYNGNLTSKQNGSVGGYMVKKMIEAQERQMADKGSM